MGRLYSNTMRLNVEIKKEVYDELARICRKGGRSISDTIRVMIAELIAEKRREEIEILMVQKAREVSDGRDRTG